MLFLIPLALEFAPAVIEAGAAFIEASPAIESAIAGVEAAVAGTTATTAATTAAATTAATTAAEATAAAAATEAAAGTAAEVGTSAAARTAASRVMSREGEEAVMNNVKAHAEAATTKAAVETGLLDKLGAVSKWGAVAGIGGKALSLAAIGGAMGYMYENMHTQATDALGDLHKTDPETAADAKHRAALIDKFAEQAAHYGMATNLSKDTAQIFNEVRQQNTHLDAAIVEINTAMSAAGAIPGMEGMHGQIQTVKVQADVVRQATGVQSNLLGSPGRLTDEQIHKASEMLARAGDNFSGPAAKSLSQARDMFDHLRPDSDIAATKAALVKFEESRNLMRQEVVANGDAVANRLQAIGDKHGQDLHQTVHELMPAIALANARHVDQQLAPAHAAAGKTNETPAQSAQPAQPAPSAQSARQPQEAASSQAPQIGFQPPPGFAQIGGGGSEFSR
jgi:hypothetical protein